MREHKYRVWDKNLQLMGYQFTKHIFAEDKTEYKTIAFSFSSGCKPLTLVEALESNNYILMQYTGLKDKNGKEICEDDIVTGYIDFVTGDILVKGSVEYNSHDARWEVLSLAGDYSIALSEIQDIEIIGTIHDNPELLNNPVSTNVTGDQKNEGKD